jgi:hypothetical protein
MNHVKCTLDENKSWCGAELDSSFHFKDIDAMVINLKHGNIMPCYECMRVIIKYQVEANKEPQQLEMDV